jgi:hypothetical protein
MLIMFSAAVDQPAEQHEQALGDQEFCAAGGGDEQRFERAELALGRGGGERGERARRACR